MCGHRSPLMGSLEELPATPTSTTLLATKRDADGRPVPRTPKAVHPSFVHWSSDVHTSTCALGELGQDVLDALAAFLHPLDLGKLGLCSSTLLRDVEVSAALLMRKHAAAKEAAAAACGEEEACAAAAAAAVRRSASGSSSAPASHRYRYLCAFEVAAAGGEKLKAALRQIYDEEDAPSSPFGGADHINLSGAQMGDAGVEHLALALRVSKAHRTVRLLNLSRCDISDHGARCLVQALQQHAIEVDTLFLGQNRIGSFGASCLAQYLASSPQKLRSLSISDNPITDEGAHTIVGALPACASLATLSMRGCQGVSSQARERLRMTWGGREGSSVFGLYI